MKAFSHSYYILFSIISASGTMAGEERRGILEMLLSYPVDRRSVVVHKFLALVVAGFVFGAFIWGAASAPSTCSDGA